MLSLKEVRTANNLTIKQLAEIVGKSASSIFAYESGKTKVPDVVYEALSKHLGITVEEMRGVVEEGAATTDETQVEGGGETRNALESATEDEIPAPKEKPAKKKVGRAKKKTVDVEEKAVDEKEPVEVEESSKKPREAKSSKKPVEATQSSKKPVRAKEPEEPAKSTKKPPKSSKSPGKTKKDLKTPASEGSVKQPAQIFIQSLMGGTISTDEIFARVKEAAPYADTIYVKPEENKAYWTGNGKLGEVELWK